MLTNDRYSDNIIMQVNQFCNFQPILVRNQREIISLEFLLRGESCEKKVYVG